LKEWHGRPAREITRKMRGATSRFIDSLVHRFDGSMDQWINGFVFPIDIRVASPQYTDS
jgi:hypothetical protein